MTERLLIDHIGHLGDGVADATGEPVFVPYALPGEVVEVEPVAGHPDRRHLLRVETPSAERIAPVCPHFTICGGCATQHWRLDRYRDWKRDTLVRALEHAGISPPVGDLIDAHGEGRRRATFHARGPGHDILAVGFMAARQHRIVAIDRCPVLASSMDGAIKAAWAIAEALGSAKKPLDIQITATDTGLDVDVRGSGPLSSRPTAMLARVADTHKLARLTRHGEFVTQRTAPTLRIGKAQVALPAGVFLQATAAGEAALARLVFDYVGDAKSVVDLFCGVGPFALRLAERARVRAADSDAPAVAALRQAAANTSGLKPVETEARDLFRQPFLPEEFKRVDAVVFDPPRQGAEAQARALAASKVPVVVAVSCNAATFARDARILVDGGYRLEAVTPVDQFRYSPHVEIVARFVR